MIPRRHSLIDDTAAVLRQRLDQGDWNGHLPGEWELSAILQVGRNTLRSALRQLEEEGRLLRRNGARREILQQPTHQMLQRRAVLLMARPESDYPPSTAVLIQELRHQLQARDWTLRILVEPAAYRRRPDAFLQSLTATHSDVVWILHRSTPALQQWFQNQNLPVVLAGLPHAGITLPHVAIHLRAVGRHAAGRFIARGHHRLAVLRPDLPLAGDVECVQAFREAAPAAEVHDWRCQAGPDGVISLLRHHLRGSNPVTGLLILHPEHCVTALSWLMSAGIRVPDQLSLICCADEPYLSFLHPEPARYRHSARSFSRRLTETVLRYPSGTRIKTATSLITPHAVPGGTLCKAPVL
jgi:DNA-binding LacI/PurR family transcriptional regulator